MQPTWIGCPASNFHRGRPQGFQPEAIIIHIIDGTFAAGEQTFLNPSSQKSAHYSVSKAGEVHQYVDEHDTAFHAGVVVNPTWPLLKPGVNPNFYTIGIEHEGLPDDIWPDVQLAASAALVGQVAARWSIPLDPFHVARHHEIRASKTCPGNFMASTTKLLALVPTGVQPVKPANTTVRTLKDVNLRQGQPSTNAPILRVIRALTDVPVIGFVGGELVNGNAIWYEHSPGNYFWAGATDFPSPVSVGPPSDNSTPGG